MYLTVRANYYENAKRIYKRNRRLLNVKSKIFGGMVEIVVARRATVSVPDVYQFGIIFSVNDRD